LRVKEIQEPSIREKQSLPLEHPDSHRGLQQIDVKRDAPGHKVDKLPVRGQQHVIRKDTLQARGVGLIINSSPHHCTIEVFSNMKGQSLNIGG